MLLVQNDELLYAGMHVNGFHHISHSGESLLYTQPDSIEASVERTRKVIAFLQTLDARLTDQRPINAT